nr:immunoglobulin heavy chain junction region [Macaca mulatta]MOW81640.1 immunoglobulin heavy chain junction region [Macaca mulatta]
CVKEDATWADFDSW